MQASAMIRAKGTSRRLLMCSALLAVFCGLAAADTAPKIVRPRLLIGREDPFTGLAILRARYAAGLRPSDDIAGWALTYLITSDESFAKRAIDEMRRTHPPEQVGSRTYMDYVRWSSLGPERSLYETIPVGRENRTHGQLSK